MGAAFGRVFHADASTMCLDDAARDREAKSRRARATVPARVSLVEPVEDVGQVLGAHTRAVVEHVDAGEPAAWSEGPPRSCTWPPEGANRIALSTRAAIA